MHTITNHHPKMNPIMEYLEELTTRPSLDEVIKKMKSFDISTDELGNYVQFRINQYSRNIIFENEYVQLLCICWKSGQRSPIHNHAQSICAVKVITGIASETVFEMTPSGYVKPVCTVDYPQGVIGSEDSDIHQISNLQAETDDLITLHCYSPPLRKMQTFFPNSKLAKTYEPSNEWHMDGSGI